MINAAPYLAPPPAPPHDPTAWRLDARCGWQGARWQGVAERGSARELVLAASPTGARTLAEANGSFGGLRPPANVALAADGSVFLLDRAAARLKRFDPCECRFDTVPCFGGPGAGPRQLAEAAAIGISRGVLHVCDRANHRVVLVALHGFVVLEHWPTPAEAGLTQPWQPQSIAFDARGRVYVSDAANLQVHRLDACGRWQRCWAGLGVPRHLASDRDGRVVVWIEDLPPRVLRLDDDGGTAPLPLDADAARERFPAPPLGVGPGGELHLGASCADAAHAARVFDAAGEPIADPPALPLPAFASAGVFRSGALDSEIDHCQWHRVVLHGALGAGCAVEVSTCCADVALSDAEIDALPEDAWRPAATATTFESGGRWDALVRSTPGRWLWLRLRLRGDGSATPRLAAIEVEFPRISLRRYLPAVFGAEPTSADFTDRFLALFDQTLRSIEGHIDRQPRWLDPLSAPAGREHGIDFLSWLGSWIGEPVDRQLPEARRRRLLELAPSLVDRRGTAAGLRRQLLLYLGVEPSRCGAMLLLEHFRLRRWLFVGGSRLGDAAVLWGERIVNRSVLDGGARLDGSQLVSTQDPPRDPFHWHAHRFTVFLPAALATSSGVRRGVERLLAAESPAHTAWQIRWVEPRFRVGVQAMLGLDSVIGRPPAPGITLGAGTPGRPAVLGAPPHAQGRPQFQLGGARVGARTRLG